MKKSLVLGFFDGVHKAHKAVITSAFKFSNDVAVITFKNSPSLYFNKSAEYIMTREQSVEKIKNLGVKEVVELDFSKIAEVRAEEYIKKLVEIYHPISISTGFNHTFGLNREGTPELLKELSLKYNFEYVCVPPVIENGEVVSSTLIKNYLRDGNVEYANYLLEDKFSLEGTVIHGAEIGRTIGFPTANINYPESIVKLPFGVYSALFNNKKAVLNWGMKPTVNNTKVPLVEVHIPDFSGNLYGQKIKIEINKRIRAEKKFNSLEELKTQIKKDTEECLK